MHTLFVQLLGILGLCMFVASYQFKSGKKLIVIQAIGNILFGIQYLWLGSVSGFIVIMFSVVRNIFIACRDRYKWMGWIGWLIILMIGYLIMAVFIWEKPSDIVPILIYEGISYVYWTENPKAIRLGNFFWASPLWFIYNFTVGSLGGVINESISMISIIVSFMRYGLNMDKSTESDNFKGN